MSIFFFIASVWVLGGALVAVLAPKLIHSALGLALSLSGLAVVYLQLGAEFAAWVQILVYVGAVAILIVFAVLLTASADERAEERFVGSWALAVAVAALVGLILTALLFKGHVGGEPLAAPGLSVRKIGHLLMTDYILALQVTGLLLTAALIGGVVLAAAHGPAGMGQATSGTDRLAGGSAESSRNKGSLT